MNKADLVDRIHAGACNISKASATTAIDTAVDSVTAALKKGRPGRVPIGFGTFSVSQRKARKRTQSRRPEQLLKSLPGESQNLRPGPNSKKQSTKGSSFS